jgi:hypothetical protein
VSATVQTWHRGQGRRHNRGQSCMSTGCGKGTRLWPWHWSCYRSRRGRGECPHRLHCIQLPGSEIDKAVPLKMNCHSVISTPGRSKNKALVSL